MLEVLHGDCLELMRAMPDDCVDLVFTSPPYEAARLYDELQFRLRGEEWVAWMLERCREMARICRGIVCVNCEGQTRDYDYSAVPILLAADLKRSGLSLRKPPIYSRKGIPGSGGPDWLRNDYEPIICFQGTRGKLPWSDNTAMGHPPKWAPGGAMSHRLSDGQRRNQRGGTVGTTGGSRKRDGQLKRSPQRPSHVFASKVEMGGKVHTKRDADSKRHQCYMPPVLANPGNIVHCVVGGGRMGSSLAHENEAPFPESLPEFFIRSFCPPDGTVLDPFCGSGTTIAVAARTGRNGIGIDVRESQVELTRRRLSTVQVELEFEHE